LSREERSLHVRRRMLHACADAWYRRHERQLATERVRFRLRVGQRTFSVTAEEALAAMSRTVHELDAALAGNPSLGVDATGRPSELAVRGLINRRLASRVIDQLRKVGSSWNADDSFSDPIRSHGSSSLTLGDTVTDRRTVGAEGVVWLHQVLDQETPETREIVIRRLALEPAEEIAACTGATPGAVRQRLSRFHRRHVGDLLDAA
jgi:hypothetical protein